MKAAVMYGPNDIRIEEIERPKCPPGGLVVEVEAVGLCGSDIRNLTTDSRQGKYPVIYGHEPSGIVVEKDADCVADVRLGDRIFYKIGLPCLKCMTCRSGRSELCNHRNKNVGEVQGAFAEYFALPAEEMDRCTLYPIPEDASMETATLADVLSAVVTCLDRIEVRWPDTVVIIGAGTAGSAMAKLAKWQGAQKVIMVDIAAQKLTMAREFGGVDETIDSSKEDAIYRVMELTDGQGADKVICCCASNQVQSDALHMAKRGGLVVYFGGVPKGTLTELDTNTIHYNSLWIYGHFSTSSDGAQKAFKLALNPKFEAHKLISHSMPLSQINEALRMAISGEAMKVVLIP
ncbi:alcohol dehydrogenase catalytic domain-containing protein [Eubacteriales bacterium OttesenSCG-928-N14]|nr:alcohol dehydrogenase catalytic domain-containing protein [Eubacteriales bacterium OttesenSCG-928-N14]